MKADSCGVCGERVGCNSIQCTKYQRWVHPSCSDVSRQVSLLSCRDVFICRTCLGHNCSMEKLEFKRGEDVLGEVEKFCYLGDKWCVNWEAGFIFEATGKDLSVLC